MKPNIIVIVTDDQTINTINAKGNKDILTPNLDKLCEEGIYFNNCNIHGGTSGAICMPSRAVLNSSQDMFSLIDAGNVIPKEHPLLGEELKKAGYQTFFSGKWHNGLDAFNRSFTMGDNIFFGGMWDHYNVPMNKFDPEGKYDNKIEYVVNFQNTSTLLEMHANKFNPGIHSTDTISSSALSFLDQVDGDIPFYLNVAYLAPHDPRVVPDKYIKMYDNKTITPPANFKFKHDFNFGQEIERDEKLAPTPMRLDWYLKEVKSYYAMITHIDAEVGKLITSLKCNKLYEESIIIFTSDNGLALGAHGLMGKQNLYNESLNVPFIIKLPKSSNIMNQEKNQLITLQDIMPTLLDLVDIEVPTNVSGKSFKDVLYGSNTILHDEIYLAYTEFIRGVLTKDYKLIKYRPRKGVEYNQLFCLKEDKLEMENLYDDPRFKEVKSKLELKLLDLRDVFEIYNNPHTKLYWDKYE